MLWVKALHIVFMVTWFAGLFYLPRLFVYHAMAMDAASIERFKIMERKLYFGIMTPGAVLTVIFGLWLWLGFDRSGGWLHAKLALVAVLVSIVLEVCEQLAQPQVMRDQDCDQRHLGVKPSAGDPIALPEPHAECDGEHGARRHDAEVELALHDLEALDADRVGGQRVVHEQPRQVEQPGEPAHHEHDVERLDPEHRAQYTAA